MPSRWFVPLVGVDPARVRPEFVHAAFTRWFDDSTQAHTATDKAYAISPLVGRPDGSLGVEIATFTAQAASRFRQASAGGPLIRLGNQSRTVGRPHLMHQHSWAGLADAPLARCWTLNIVTPATFRTGDRSSPMPSVSTIIGALSRAWESWSGLTLRPVDQGSVWVSELELRSMPMEFVIRGRPVKISGVTGRLTLRCDDQAAAAVVNPLLRLAAYTGIGGLTQRGLGVTRVVMPNAGTVGGRLRHPHRTVSARHGQAPASVASGPAVARDGLAS